MPLSKVQFAPGIDKQITTYGAEGKWVDSKNVRFRNGLPEKIGGWSKVQQERLVGVARSSHAWVSLNGVRYIAIGTDRKLYVYSEGVSYDITPLRLEAALSNPFTTNGTATVSVAHTSHGASVGDFVTFDSFSAINGLDMNGEFEVTTVTDANNYTVTHTNSASGSTSGGGGSGNAKYQLPVGAARSSYGFGWGTGTWGTTTGADGWGEARQGSNLILEATSWSFDTFGEDLLALRGDGALYRWDLSSGTSNRAVKITQAPGTSRVVLVSSPDRHIFLMGTETTIGQANTQDDLFFRFSSQEDFTTWTPSSTNTAGSFRVQDGSKIMAAVRSRGSILVWTDTALHVVNNIGPPFIFGLTQIGSNCGAVSPQSMAEINGVTYWMSQTSFYMFDGAVKKLDCLVQDYVYDDIETSSYVQICCGINSDYNEVTWYYASNGSDYLDRSVTYNYLENVWYTNDLARTTWIDRGVYPKPYGVYYSPTSLPNNEVIHGVTAGCATIYSHETGLNADGGNMEAYITSGDFDIEDGQTVFHTSRVIPDFKNQVGDVTIDINFANYPTTNNIRTFQKTGISPTTKYFSVRGRGRQANIKISNNSVDTDWRFGTLRLDVTPDGAR